jgi:hypothetical protein
MSCFFTGDNKYSWTTAEVAGVIYSDDQTNALFCILEKPMSLGPKKLCINKGEYL